MGAARDCREQAPHLVDCAATAVAILAESGDCRAVADIAEQVRASRIDRVAGPVWLADGLAWTGAEPERIGALLKEAAKAARTWGRGAVIAQLFDLRLALYEGRFADADAIAVRLGRGNARAAAGVRAVTRARIALEIGDRSTAIHIAETFLRREDAFAIPARLQTTDALSGDPVPRLLGVLSAAGAVDNIRWQGLVQRWLGVWQGLPTVPGAGAYRWALGYARAVGSPAEATLAVAELEPREPPPALYPGILAAHDVARTLQLAGRDDRARPWVQRAAANCNVLREPISANRAMLALAAMHERDGATDKACAAYAVIERRWRAAAPTPTTLTRARARLQALECGGAGQGRQAP